MLPACHAKDMLGAVPCRHRHSAYVIAWLAAWVPEVCLTFTAGSLRDGVRASLEVKVAARRRLALLDSQQMAAFFQV